MCFADDVPVNDLHAFARTNDVRQPCAVVAQRKAAEPEAGAGGDLPLVCEYDELAQAGTCEVGQVRAVGAEDEWADLGERRALLPVEDDVDPPVPAADVGQSHPGGTEGEAVGVDRVEGHSGAAVEHDKRLPAA